MKFTFEEGLNKKGTDLLAAYTIYMNESTPEIVKRSLGEMMRRDINAKRVRNAFEDGDTVEEFEAVLRQYSTYMRSNADVVNEALDFVRANLPADLEAETMKKSNKVVIQKRVGMKQTQVEDYFGVDKARASSLMANGFVSTFLDTYIRKKVNIILADQAKLLDGVKVDVSAVYKVDGRNMFNMNVDFTLTPKDLDTDMIDRVVRVIGYLEGI